MDSNKNHNPQGLDKYAIKITNSETQEFYNNKHFLTINQNPDFEISPRRDEMKPKEIAIPLLKKKKSNNLTPKNHVITEEEKSIIKNIDKKITDYIKERKDIEIVFNDPEIKQYLSDD